MSIETLHLQRASRRQSQQDPNQQQATRALGLYVGDVHDGVRAQRVVEGHGDHGLAEASRLRQQPLGAVGGVQAHVRPRAAPATARTKLNLGASGLGGGLRHFPTNRGLWKYPPSTSLEYAWPIEAGLHAKPLKRHRAGEKCGVWVTFGVCLICGSKEPRVQRRNPQAWGSFEPPASTSSCMTQSR